MTLPFLVGAVTETSGARAGKALYETLVAVLESMRDETPHTSFVRVSECDLLHQPVANKIGRDYRPGAGFRPVPSPVDGRASLFVEAKYLVDPARGIESVAETVWDLCSLAILKSRFTFKDGRYVAFEADDRDFIARATAMAERSEV